MFNDLKAKLVNLHKSWTFWFNAFVGALIPAIPLAAQNIPELAPFLPANVYQYLSGALVIGNWLLRLKTNSSLADK